MDQKLKDAVIMKEIIENILHTLHNHDVMFSKESVRRFAYILMAWSVTMIGMSSNDVADFREKARLMVDNIASMLDQMDPTRRGKVMSAIDEQMSWFKKAHELNKQHAEDAELVEAEAQSEKAKKEGKLN
ncbi:MAG TPA: hypothetical protein VMX17_14550 [Candidatus Glassbacteria bacterium]|nr:hypothetical protein [Candidatus Glassbacteria bacterium]